MDLLSKSVLTLPPNDDLPVLPVWRVPSFWAQVLALLTALLNTFGIDLMGFFAAIGWGASPAEIVTHGERAVSAIQQLLPFVFGFWSFIERRAPHFRLVFWRK